MTRTKIWRIATVAVASFLMAACQAAVTPKTSPETAQSSTVLEVATERLFSGTVGQSACDGVESDVRGYIGTTPDGKTPTGSHVTRWQRVLVALGVTDQPDGLSAMTAAEAKTYADRGWSRWDPVVDCLKEIETPPQAQQSDQVAVDYWVYHPDRTGADVSRPDTTGATNWFIEGTTGGSQELRFTYSDKSGSGCDMSGWITASLSGDGGSVWLTGGGNKPTGAPSGTATIGWNDPTCAHWGTGKYRDFILNWNNLPSDGKAKERLVTLTWTHASGGPQYKTSFKMQDDGIRIACEWTTDVTEINEGGTFVVTPNNYCSSDSDDNEYISIVGINDHINHRNLQGYGNNYRSPTRVTHRDDNEVLIPSRAIVITTAANAKINGNTFYSIPILEDDASSIRLEKKNGEWEFNVWRKIQAPKGRFLTMDLRGFGWVENGTSLTSEKSITINFRFPPSWRELTRLLGKEGITLVCTKEAQLRFKTLQTSTGENLSALTPGTGRYVSVHPTEWTTICGAVLPAAKATATLTMEKRYQCHGMNILMGKHRLDVEWATEGADANGIEIGVSKNLGLGEGVYRSSATRINLSVGNLTPNQIMDTVNGKTTFQNDSRANPIRITAAYGGPFASKMNDDYGVCELGSKHKLKENVGVNSFLGFDVTAPRTTFSGGRD